MRNSIRPNHVANEIRMKRNIIDKSFLLVEGDDDCRFFRNFIDKNKCQLKQVEGKPNVITTVQKLNESNTEGVLAIVDADFDNLNNTNYPGNIILTDTHDIETMISKTKAFNKIIYEYADEQSIESFEKRISNKLKDIILNSASIIGFLRWISQREKLMLQFRDIEFEYFINERTLEVEIDSLILHVLANSNKSTIDKYDLHDLYTDLDKNQIDKWQIASGHDFVKIVNLGLKRVFGYRRNLLLSPQDIERILRVSYTYDELKKTYLYGKIRDWEIRNNSYKVFV